MCSSDLAPEPLRSRAPNGRPAHLHAVPRVSAPTREHPFLAEILLNQPITGRASGKDVRHVELDIESSGLAYLPGDSLGVLPTNPPQLVDALRIDHPDGLADPRGYFQQLHEATGGAWVVAEKILEGEEVLPQDWPVAGTTGYEFIAALAAVLVDAGKAEELDAVYAAAAGPGNGFEADRRDAKLRDDGCDIVATGVGIRQTIVAFGTAKRLGWEQVPAFDVPIAPSQLDTARDE